jgi:lipid A 3-O-deacylase
VKIKIHLFTVLALTFIVFNCFSQDHLPSREVNISTSNDAYTWKMSDRYYTNGIRIDYRSTLSNVKGVGKALSKIGINAERSIAGVKLGQDIYTPRSTIWKPKSFDRPYAGWLFGGVNVNNSINKSTILEIDFEAGVTGEWAKAREVQLVWHELFNFEEAKNWDLQIKNSFGTNLTIGLSKEIIYKRYISLITETYGQGGTIFNNVSQSGTIRLGKIQRLGYSVYKGVGLLQPRTKGEFFIFAGIGARYNFYNALIEGNIFNNEITTTKGAIPLTTSMRWGMNYGTNKFNFLFTIYNLSPEVVNGINHQYATISTIFRF